MGSFLSSVPSWVFTFFTSNFELVLGYCICVLFPIPYINSTIIALWGKLLSTGVVTPTPVAPVVVSPTPVVPPAV